MNHGPGEKAPSLKCLKERGGRRRQQMRACVGSVGPRTWPCSGVPEQIHRRGQFAGTSFNIHALLHHCLHVNKPFQGLLRTPRRCPASVPPPPLHRGARPLSLPPPAQWRTQAAQWRQALRVRPISAMADASRVSPLMIALNKPPRADWLVAVHLIPSTPWARGAAS